LKQQQGNQDQMERVPRPDGLDNIVVLSQKFGEGIGCREKSRLRHYP